MERSLRIQMIGLFLCIPLLALGDAAALARHYRVVPNHARIVAKLGSYLFAHGRNHDLRAKPYDLR